MPASPQMHFLLSNVHLPDFAKYSLPAICISFCPMSTYLISPDAHMHFLLSSAHLLRFAECLTPPICISFCPMSTSLISPNAHKHFLLSNAHLPRFAECPNSLRLHLFLPNAHLPNFAECPPHSAHISVSHACDARATEMSRRLTIVIFSEF